MSLHAWRLGRDLAYEDASFVALLFAAMMRADRPNLGALSLAFPDLFEEFRARCEAPGGRLPGDGPVTS